MNTLQKEKRVSNKSKNIEETNKSNDLTADGASASPERQNRQDDDARRIVPIPKHIIKEAAQQVSRAASLMYIGGVYRGV